MSGPDGAAAERYAIERLKRELDSHFFYHSLWHSRDEVLPAAVELARLEGLDAPTTLLVRTAALFHDLGFVVRLERHEEAGVEIARQALPGFGFSGEQIEQIAGMILATRLPQRPTTPAERVIADADLDVLGRSDFCERNRTLLRELVHFGLAPPRAEWLGVQMRFLGEHRYFTASARRMRDEGKRHNLAELPRCYGAAAAG